VLPASVAPPEDDMAFDRTAVLRVVQREQHSGGGGGGSVFAWRAAVIATVAAQRCQ
jgi:hypothetical protein